MRKMAVAIAVVGILLSSVAAGQELTPKEKLRAWKNLPVKKRVKMDQIKIARNVPAAQIRSQRDAVRMELKNVVTTAEDGKVRAQAMNALGFNAKTDAYDAVVSHKDVAGAEAILAELDGIDHSKAAGWKKRARSSYLLARLSRKKDQPGYYKKKANRKAAFQELATLATETDNYQVYRRAWGAKGHVVTGRVPKQWQQDEAVVLLGSKTDANIGAVADHLSPHIVRAVLEGDITVQQALDLLKPVARHWTLALRIAEEEESLPPVDLADKKDSLKALKETITSLEEIQ